MHITTLALQRHSCKAFDASKKIPDDQMQQLLDVLRLSASSVNSQPWHFFVAHSDDGKKKIASATDPGYSYNTAKIMHASHVVAICARTELQDDYLARLLSQETQDGRLPTAEAQQKQDATRRFYVGLHQQAGDICAWTQKQAYLSLGTLLFAASALGIDACPMEGFDGAALDAKLGLTEQGLSSVVLVALGYRSADDFNGGLPKSRLPATDVITYL